MGRGLLLLGAATIALAMACEGDGDPLQELVDESEPASWDLRPGVEIVTVTGADPGQELTLYDEEAQERGTLLADEEGRAHFSYIPDEPGDEPLDEVLAAGYADGGPVRPGEYVIRDDTGGTPLASERFRVRGHDEVPEPQLYEGQELGGVELDVLGQPVEGADLDDGFQYIEMRDGVTLSAMVRFPDRDLYGDAPWPTVIELSGYSPSNPRSEEPGSRLLRSLGYATVSVNLRGTGCSGGIFDTFNAAQMADGYDIVETVARQPWVLNEQVGMIGLSYSGITQLYTAATAPPGLAAVTAQSVIADPWLQQWPGGIYNHGFTRQWLRERERQSAPGGSSWIQDRIDAGDDTCTANVAEHELNIDFAAFGQALDMRPPAAADRDLRLLADDIETAVLVTGAFQDEQTGPQFAAMLDEFDNAEILRANLWNGRHPDGYSTMSLMDVFEHLELYVAERTPQFPEPLRSVVAAEVASSFGFSEGELAPNRLADRFGDDYEAALAFYEDEDPIRVVFGNGLGGTEVGAPGGVDELRLAAWPSPDARPRTWNLAPGGELEPDRRGGGAGRGHGGQSQDAGDEVAGRGGAGGRGRASASFGFDPEAGDAVAIAGDYSVLESVPDYDWTRFPEDRSVSFRTEPLPEDTLLAGPGYADLRIGVEGPEGGEPPADADVQVAISEVREDGTELLLQTGWLRLGHRAEDGERSTDLEVVHPFTEEAYQPLGGDMVRARVPIPSVGHELASGSRLELTVSSPGRNHVTWKFQPPEGVDEDTRYTVRLGPGRGNGSSLVLPVLDAEVDMPADIPCPGLRGVPCREP